MSIYCSIYHIFFSSSIPADLEGRFVGPSIWNVVDLSHTDTGKRKKIIMYHERLQFSLT